METFLHSIIKYTFLLPYNFAKCGVDNSWSIEILKRKENFKRSDIKKQDLQKAGSASQL